MNFQLTTKLKPKGDQPQAIKKLSEGYAKYAKQTLVGITGSGKTFSMANIIQSLQKPTLVIAHNKTLAAQLYHEFKTFFPNNAVEYFVSYYDYYQPESYLPATDTYIEKDAQINEKLDQLRLKATASLLSRRDVIVVASVSCIYGLGSPINFRSMSLELTEHQNISRSQIMEKLLDSQYQRNDLDQKSGTFRVSGDTIDLIPSYEDDIIRIELFGNQIDRITRLDKVTKQKKQTLPNILIFPARHYVIPAEEQERALAAIKMELEEHLPSLPPLFAHRLAQRTKYDLEMIRNLGYCSGIENYSRHFDKRNAGDPPYCLLDFFPEDALFFIDESHQTIPQTHGMYKGDYSRKKNLVDFGFRLPSAFDNRPLKFPEFEKYLRHVIFVSATPSEYEIKSSGQVVEQIIRPTGLLDPSIQVRKTKGQVPDLIEEIKQVIKKKSRILVTTLTKRMAEELTNYFAGNGINARYLHSEIETIERTELIRQLRVGEFDVLVGINLLREGLDIPEVSLVAILDADKEGFLRDERSLIQTTGRAARNVNGRVIMYADTLTKSMKRAMEITHTRREKQIEYNKAHKITPKTIFKDIPDKQVEIKDVLHIPKADIPKLLKEVEMKMNEAANKLDFEAAIVLREQMKKLQERAGKKLKNNGA